MLCGIRAFVTLLFGIHRKKKKLLPLLWMRLLQL